MAEAVRISETSAYFETTRRYVQEDRYLHNLAAVRTWNLTTANSFVSTFLSTLTANFLTVLVIWPIFRRLWLQVEISIVLNKTHKLAFLLFSWILFGMLLRKSYDNILQNPFRYSKVEELVFYKQAPHMATGFGSHTMYREMWCTNDVSDYITLLVKSRLIETQKLNAHHWKSNSNSFFPRMWKKCAFIFCVAITLLSINLCNLTSFVITLYI
jgi:hypothetical protein